MRGMKTGNEYAWAFGRLYAQTPKAVFAAVAFSLCQKDAEAESRKAVIAAFLAEWDVLNQNGIVPQKAPK